MKTAVGELVALAAYEISENDVMVHITYIESQPESNPMIVGRSKKYSGIERVLIAYGIKLSIDHDRGGRSFLKQKCRNRPSIMYTIFALLFCPVLTAHQDTNFPVKPL